MDAKNSNFSVNYEAIFKGGSAILMVLGTDTPKFTIMAVSDLFLIATMRTREQVVGKGIFEAFPPNPADPQSQKEKLDVLNSLDRVIKFHKQDNLPLQKYDIKTSDSKGDGFETRYWSPVHFPILDDEGKLIHIVQKVEDVTELFSLKNREMEKTEINKKLQDKTGKMELELLLRAQEVKDANVKLMDLNEVLEKKSTELEIFNDKLKELDRLKTDFFANISHEFRTPLTLILGPLEELLARNDPSYRQPVQVVYKNALRLLKLVNSLLNFSKIEAGRMNAVFELTDMANLTVDLASNFRSAIERAGLTYVVEYQPVPSSVYVDHELWEKIVINLISNAFKFTLKGSIRVSLKPSKDFVEFSVTDTGSGISEEEIPRLFQRFYRIPKSIGRTIEGTGIGLALVQELVTLHGGKVEVTSKIGEGSTFTVKLPYGKEHLPKEQIAVNKVQRDMHEATFLDYFDWIPQQEIAKIELNSTKPLIVLADDNKDMRDYAQRILQQYYRVIAVSDGSKALEAIREYNPVLAVSDIMMPDMNGIELLRALREDERFQSLPVILFSARTEETRGSEIGLGANDYLTKPFSAKELLSRVRTQILLHEIRNKALHQVTLANKELEAFSYSVSHDLRAPLRHIASFSQILIEDYADKLDDQGRDYIKRVLASTIRMSRLIDDLLNLSRITRHNISNNKVDLSALARKITEDYKANNPSSALEANIEEGIVVQGDAGLLEIVLDNLFGNALKFSSTRPRPKVSFGSKVKNGITYYFIKDNGVGFDMAYKNKLFGTFERLHSQEQFPGNGIGLATVQRIIQRHGGHIFAESKVEEGATFYFSIIPSDQT